MDDSRLRYIYHILERVSLLFVLSVLFPHPPIRCFCLRCLDVSICIGPACIGLCAAHRMFSVDEILEGRADIADLLVQVQVQLFDPIYMQQ